MLRAPNRRLVLLSVLLLTVCVWAWQNEGVKQQLPPPFATPSAANPPRVVPRPPDAQLHVPQGFRTELWAEGFRGPRFMLLGSHGILLADSHAGVIYAIEGVAKAGARTKIIEGLHHPYGLAFWKDYLYVAEPDSVKRYKYDAKAMKVNGAGEQVIDLQGLGSGHWTRSLLFDAKGEKLYVGVGSASNDSAGEDPRRAAIDLYNADGSGHSIFASGTRNPIGIHWYPGSATLWAAVQERDGLGDNLPPDFFTHVQPGGFYGWPYAYTGPHPDPRHKGQEAELVKKTIVPDVLLGPHVAVLDFTFYTGNQFPERYRGGAFLAFHGSWNRARRVGYEMAFVPFKNGKPAGPVEDFLTGFMVSPASKDVWGRPVAVLQLPDGSLLMSEDGNGTIWRVSYGQ